MIRGGKGGKRESKTNLTSYVASDEVTSENCPKRTLGRRPIPIFSFLEEEKGMEKGLLEIPDTSKGEGGSPGNHSPGEKRGLRRSLNNLFRPKGRKNKTGEGLFSKVLPRNDG